VKEGDFATVHLLLQIQQCFGLDRDRPDRLDRDCVIRDAGLIGASSGRGRRRGLASPHASVIPIYLVCFGFCMRPFCAIRAHGCPMVMLVSVVSISFPLSGTRMMRSVYTMPAHLWGLLWAHVGVVPVIIPSRPQPLHTYIVTSDLASRRANMNKMSQMR
jgi:hypothetical protein